MEARVSQSGRRGAQFMRRKGIHEYATIEDGVRPTGKTPASRWWVNKTKGTAEEPRARRRLVMHDFRVGKAGDGLCMCPCLRSRRGRSSSRRPPRGTASSSAEGRRCTVESYGHQREEGPPRGQSRPRPHVSGVAGIGREGGVLREAEHWSVRDAGGGNWMGRGMSKMVGIGLIPGKYAPTVFRHQTRDLCCVVHGVDFTCGGISEDLEAVSGRMHGFDRGTRSMSGVLCGPRRRTGDAWSS